MLSILKVIKKKYNYKKYSICIFNYYNQIMQFSTYSGISSTPGLLQYKITKSRTEVIHELYILTAKSSGPRKAELMTQ